MNINTNYSIQPLQLRNHKDIKSSVPEQNNTVNFTGLPNCLRPMMKQTVKLDNEMKDFAEHAGSILSISGRDMQKHIQGKTKGHIRLLNAMLTKFNGTNFGKPQAERENSEIVIDLLKRIESPKEEHIGFINRSRLSMTDVYACFNKCKDDPKKLSSLEDMYAKLRSTHRQDDFMKQIISSPNTEEYVANIDTYLPHLQACEESKGLIEKFDKQIAQKSSDFKSLYNNSNINKLLRSYPETAVFSREALTSNYTKEGSTLLYIMSAKFEATKSTMEAGDAKGFMRIYKTTTPENFQFRKDFICANYHNFGRRDKMSKNEVNDLAVILDYADKNPSAKKFLSGLSEHETGLRSAPGYIELFDKIGAERLSQDIKPIYNMIRNDSYTPTQTVMKYYETIKAQPKNVFRSIRDIVERKAEIKQSEVSIREELKGDSMVRQIEITSPAPRMSDIINNPIAKPIDPIETVQPEKVRRSFFKPFVPKAPNAIKLVVINDVDGIIKKKLGTKVYEEQKSIYANNATKMRAQMLPEIFESIKETRAMERANGTFKKHSSISNEEAADLYRRINGKNKKLVNYMLKKTDAKGNRMFSVRDILDTLADANRSILEGQRNSTKLNRFSAKDERAIYDSILENKTAEFGKLQSKRVSKK